MGLDGALFVAIVGLMVAPLYYLVYNGFMKVERRLTKIETQCVYCILDDDKEDQND